MIGMKIDELEELIADAKRYRWLKDNGKAPEMGISIGDIYKAKVAFRYWIPQAELDSVIDAAIINQERTTK